MASENTNERLEKIESHLAHLERFCDQLSEALIEQGKVLQRMQAQQQKVAKTLDAIELDRIRSTNPKPPHYQ